MNQVGEAAPSGARLEPDFFPPGSKICFVCLSSQDLSQTLRKVFENYGFVTTGTHNVETAREKLRLNQYQAVVVEAGPDFREIFAEINTWPGNVRRDTNVIVMGRKAPSLHQQMAFVMGANYYLNFNDAAKMEDLIKQVIEGYKDYYQIWNQAREEADAI